MNEDKIIEFRQGIDRTLRDYSERLHDFSDRSENPIVRHARHLFARELIAPVSGAREAMDLDEGLVIHTGPHSQLLLDPPTLADLALGLIGRAGRPRRPLLWYGCSTVTLESGTQHGSGWLRIDDRPHNIFDLSRSRLARTSVCAETDQICFSPTLPPKASAPTTRTQDMVASISERLPDGCFCCANAAFGTANRAMWPAEGDDVPPLVAINDRAVGRLLAAHLDDGEGVMHALMFDESRRTRLEAAAAEEEHDPFASTSLCWHVRERRIRPTRIADGWVFDGDTAVAPMRADTIVPLLREGTLLPSLLPTFLVIGMLPGNRVLGGARQYAYYPAMQRVLRAALRDDDPHEAALAEGLDDDGHAWSFGALDPSMLPDLQPFEEGFVEAVRELGELPLIATSLNFSALE